MLAGVNANDLEALLEFVYRGEVSVDHSQLPSLLQAAQCLNIQGLAPQTVVASHKDEYATAIQLHPHLVPQHHVKIDVGNNTVVSFKSFHFNLVKFFLSVLVHISNDHTNSLFCFFIKEREFYFLLSPPPPPLSRE